MAGEFDRLKTEVSEMSAKVDEIVAFIRANVNDPAALAAFADELDADQAKLDAAMAPTPTV